MLRRVWAKVWNGILNNRRPMLGALLVVVSLVLDSVPWVGPILSPMVRNIGLSLVGATLQRLRQRWERKNGKT